MAKMLLRFLADSNGDKDVFAKETDAIRRSSSSMADYLEEDLGVKSIHK